MIIAISTNGSQPEAGLDPRFGRAEYFVLFNTETKTFSHIDNTEVKTAAHGAGPLTAQKLSDASVQVVITGNGPGGNAARVLEQAGIQVLLCKDEVSAREAVSRYQRGELS